MNVLKKAAINFAMIQTMLMATSFAVANQIPASNPYLVIVLFVYVMAFLFTLLPSIGVSFLFAAFSQ